ncbi:hypothetical protein CBS470a_001953 [Neofusicoccum parvum]|uniref:Uncharacterized protein n=1 Tax=Neofusicoccum parvum TaxID=310453 RepID=A0ACB5SHB4_9PEZI|nr:hypothetical protein CBS470a_001953 [Neofusicoccum parvum]
MTEYAENNQPVILSDKVAEFTADIITMLSFAKPWGFIRNSRDERNILSSWRRGLNFLPSTDNSTGMGYLMSQADAQVTERESLPATKLFARGAAAWR